MILKLEGRSGEDEKKGEEKRLNDAILTNPLKKKKNKYRDSSR